MDLGVNHRQYRYVSRMRHFDYGNHMGYLNPDPNRREQPYPEPDFPETDWFDTPVIDAHLIVASKLYMMSKTLHDETGVDHLPESVNSHIASYLFGDKNDVSFKCPNIEICVLDNGRCDEITRRMRDECRTVTYLSTDGDCLASAWCVKNHGLPSTFDASKEEIFAKNSSSFPFGMSFMRAFERDTTMDQAVVIMYDIALLVIKQSEFCTKLYENTPVFHLYHSNLWHELSHIKFYGYCPRIKAMDLHGNYADADQVCRLFMPLGMIGSRSSSTLKANYHLKISNSGTRDFSITEYVDSPLSLPDYDLILLDNGDFSLTELSDEADSISFSGQNNSYIIKRNLMKRIQHDMVLDYFCEVLEHDMSVGEFFGKINEKHIDNPTPDIMTEIQSRLIMTEIGTTRNPHGTRTTYKTKYEKLIDIANSKNSELKIVAVSQTEVTHNIILNPSDCINLCSRFLYGLNVKNRALELGWVEEDDEDEISKQVENEFVNFDYEILSEDPLCSNELGTRLFNENYIEKLLEDTKEEFRKEMSSDDMSNVLIKEYKDRVNAVGEEREPSAVSPICLFSLKADSYFPDPVPEITDDLYNTFWNYLMINDISQEGSTYDDCENMVLEVVDERDERLAAPNKHERHVYNLEKNHSLDLALAQCGVQGKKYRKDMEKLNKELQSRKSYSFSCDTSDIENFLNSYRHMVKREDNPLSDRFKFLIDYADEMKHNTSIVDSLLNSKMGCMLTTFSAIMCEINLNSRKKMKGRQWSVVRHPALPCYIAVHTSKANSHVFYSILFRNVDVVDLMERPFRTIISLGDGLSCTPICSLTHHDLSMWISLPNMFLSMTSVWADVCNYDILTNGLSDHPFGVEVMYSLLECLEHKENSVTPTFNARYMYMELLKPAKTICSPFKVLSKYPNIIRSRLLLYNIKRLIFGFKFMLQEREKSNHNVPIRDEDEAEEIGKDNIPLSMDKIPNLISYISGQKLETFEQAINISYIGVFHNVDKGEQTHGYLKIFSKVIKEELTLRDSRMEYMSMENEDEPRPSEYMSHEFSPNHMRKIASTLKNHFKRKGIYRKDVRKAIFKNLSEVTFSELATFKASANSENFMGNHDPDYDGYDQKRRNKAMQEVIKLMEELESLTKTPYTNLKKLFKKLEESGGIIANLFKKNQPTGVREIFVLTMVSRIVVKILESISRTLCEMADNEYLTKGSKKSTASTAHFSSIKSKKNDNDVSLTVSDSADATTWCQRFIMNVFRCFFSEFFSDDQDIMRVINSILNLMTLKRLELPKQLLDLFKSNYDILSFDQGMNELKSQFFGDSLHEDLMEANKILMKNRSNFMQGILHYTSSIIHSSHMLWFEQLVEALFINYLGRLYGDSVYIQSKTKVSSDDSSRQTTIIVRSCIANDPKVLVKVRHFLLFTSSLLICSYPLFSAKLSREKSTTHILTNIEEFNSEWTVVNTIVTPKIKWSYSSQVLQTTTSMSERQNVDHGLINDLIQNGCRRQTTQVCEFGAMLNHYSSIGFYTLRNEFFMKLMEEIFSVKSNMGYFYYLSHHMLGTTLGFSCTKWLNLKMYKEARLSEMVTMRSTFGFPQVDGSMDFSLSLPIGYGKNYKKFLEAIGLMNEDIDQMLDGKEHVLFGETSSSEEELLKIKVKALSSGASKAFSFSSASKQHSVSAYINTAPCLNGRCKDTLMKYSLPAAIKLIKDNWSSEYMADDTMYPQMRIYESVVSSCERMRFVPQNRRKRKILMKIEIPNLSRVSQIPLINCLKKLWFNIDVRAAKFQITSSFRKYSLLFPWLALSFSESYRNYCELYGETSKILFSQHLTNLSHKDRSFKFHHQGKHEAMIENQLIDCVCSNMKIGHDYIKTNTIKPIKNIQSDLLDYLESCESKLAELSNAPPCKIRDNMMSNTCFLPRDMIHCNIDTTIRSLPTRLVPLFVMMHLEGYTTGRMRDIDTSEVIDCISIANQGTIAFYKQEQKRNRNGEYKGTGVVLGICDGVRFSMVLFDDEIVKLSCENPTMLYTKRYEFSRFLQKIKCKPRMTGGGKGIYLVKGGNLEKDSAGLLVHREPILIDEIKDLQLTLEVNRQNGLSLKFTAKGLSGDTLAYYPRYQKKAEFKHPTFDEGMDCWLQDKPVDSHWLKQVLDDGDDDMIRWCRDTLKLRLQQLSILKATMPSIEETTVEKLINVDNFNTLFDIDNDFMEETLAQMNFDEVNDDFVAIMENQDEIERAIEDAHEFINFFDDEYQEVHVRNFDMTKRLFVMNRSFWDSVIFKMRNLISTQGNSLNMSMMGEKSKAFFKSVGFVEQTLSPYIDDFSI